MEKWLWFYIVLLLLLCGATIQSCKKKQAEPARSGSRSSLSHKPSVPPAPAAQRRMDSLKPGASAILPINTGALQTPNEMLPLSKLAGEQQPKTIQLDEPAKTDYKVLLDKTGNNYPFLTEKTPVLLPIDYKIGPLQELIGNDKEQQSIVTVLNSFFTGIIKGKIEKALLLQENSFSLQGYLDYNLKKKSNIPVKFRLGKIAIKKDSAQVNIRLFSAKGVTEGEVFVQKKENSWYISDLQVNLDLLSTDYGGLQEKFMPAGYYWMLNEK